MIGLWLASRQWEHFIHGFSYLFSIQGVAVSVTTIILVKVLHELGHAFTCKKYRARVATMGITFILFWPVLYTDVTGAWRIQDKYQRMMIGAAGMLTEALVAAWALLLWNFVDEGILKSVLFTLATTSLLVSLSVNLSPLMRFDGYFIFSDWLDMPNLQPRAFAMARWRMRKFLLGWHAAPPESPSLSRRRMVVMYAFATWIYRLFLYFGIALAVYHFVFKALGIVLFMAEIIYLLVIPLTKEVRLWVHHRDVFAMNFNLWRTVAGAALICVAFLVPWHHTIRAPAVLMAQQQQQLFVAQDARLAAQFVRAGEDVIQGQLLFKFTSPALDQAINALEVRRSGLEKQIRAYPFDKRASADLTVIRDELVQVRHRINQQMKLKQQLTLRAPFSGRIADVPETLRTGVWMAAGDILATLVGKHGIQVEAYINERDMGRIHGAENGVFIADDIHRHEVVLSLDRLAGGVVADLRAHPELSSPYGGEIAAHLDRKQQIPIPQQALYLAYFSAPDVSAPESQIRGEIFMEGEAQSFIYRIWNSLMGVLIRESVM
jgi:putative peptide zinc metalloprotease protein